MYISANGKSEITEEIDLRAKLKKIIAKKGIWISQGPMNLIEVYIWISSIKSMMWTGKSSGF